MNMCINHLLFRGFLVLLAAAALVPVSVDFASAHSLYIQSGRHRVTEGKKTPLFFCYGHHFPVDDGVRQNKLAKVRVIDPAGSATDMALRKETCLHSYMVEYDQPGIYVLTAESNPGHYTKWVDKKGRDRSTIKPMSAIVDKASRVVKSLYSKQYAKSYVRCGDPDGKFQAQVGLPLELVPLRDPTTLKPGDVLELQVYRDGKPYRGEGQWDATFGGFSTESEDLFHPRTVTKDGAVKVRLDHSGRWFIRYFIKTDASEDKKEEYLQLKQTATLVVLVPNERRQPLPGHH